MKTLLILRHAKSSWKNPGLADHNRPLNKRGKRDAPRVGRLLRDKNLTPDLILSSTAKRALDTAEAAAESSGYEGEINHGPSCTWPTRKRTSAPYAASPTTTSA